jgi:hypothetical protein
LKEAEQASLKESERLEKEIAELREMKVGLIFQHYHEVHVFPVLR